MSTQMEVKCDCGKSCWVDTDGVLDYSKMRLVDRIKRERIGFLLSLCAVFGFWWITL